MSGVGYNKLIVAVPKTTPNDLSPFTVFSLYEYQATNGNKKSNRYGRKINTVRLHFSKRYFVLFS
jgi:hypothetical protein